MVRALHHERYLLDHKFSYLLSRPDPSTVSGLKAVEGPALRRLEGSKGERPIAVLSKDYEEGACIVPSFIIASTELNILIS